MARGMKREVGPAAILEILEMHGTPIVPVVGCHAGRLGPKARGPAQDLGILKDPEICRLRHRRTCTSRTSWRMTPVTDTRLRLRQCGAGPLEIRRVEVNDGNPSH